MQIHTQGVRPGGFTDGICGYCARELLAGEVTRTRVRVVSIASGCAYPGGGDETSWRILFFISGVGAVAGSGLEFHISGSSLFLPAYGQPYLVKAEEGLELLEIAYEPEDGDSQFAEKMRSPRYLPYADCATYREEIKSEKTVNRTIVEPDLLPRFCMGSVESIGEDAVGEHSHPMIDQLFFGLPGNSCLVTADGEEARFEQNMLLHIPPGSAHGVTVEQGRRLHYLWMDFFKDNDMSFIKQQHLADHGE